MQLNFKDPYLFLSYIISNSAHDLDSLSEILDIPKKRLKAINKLTKLDCVKINELRELIFVR